MCWQKNLRLYCVYNECVKWKCTNNSQLESENKILKSKQYFLWTWKESHSNQIILTYLHTLLSHIFVVLQLRFGVQEVLDKFVNE